MSAAKQAIKLDPGYAQAYLMVGTLLRWDKQRQAEAITAYETALSINPQLWSAYDELGAIFESANEQKRAEDPRHKACLSNFDHADTSCREIDLLSSGFHASRSCPLGFRVEQFQTLR